MADIIDLISSANVKTYWDATKEDEEQYVGIDELFANSELQLEDTIDAISGASGYTPALLLNAPDSKTVYRERQTIEVSQKKIPMFKEGMQVDEKHLIDLMKLEGNPNKELTNMVKARIFNDSKELYRSARMTQEIMIMQLLGSGTVSMASNGNAFSVSYGIPDANKIAVSDLTYAWSNASADILADIRNFKKKAKINGDAYALLDTTTFGYLLNNTKITNLLKNANGAVDVRDQDVIDLVYSRTKVRLYVVDGYYKADNGSDTQLFLTKTFTLFPAGRIGTRVFAMTPEQRVLLQKPDSNVAVVDKGIAIVTHIENDAVAIQTKIAMRMLPRLDIFPDKIVIATVAS